jgi:membrane protease YdiL (CAAX protease family)
MLTRRQVALLVHAVAIIAALVFAVPLLTGASGGVPGYVLSLALLWLGFCLPVIAIHVWPQRGDLFSERLHWRQWWIPLALMVQVGIITLLVFAPNTAVMTTHAAMLATVIGLVNAPLEETAWRGGFLKVFADRPRLGFWLGWLFATAAHAPFLLSINLVIDGGWPFILGTAAALGLFWGAIVWRTGSVFWTSIAHTLTDILVLWLLLDRNALP